MPPNPKHNANATGHIVYSCTPALNNIFLHETSSIVYSAKKFGRETPPQTMSKELRELLSNNGFELSQHERKYTLGVNYFCGIKIEITKIKEQGETKQLFITVYGESNKVVSEKLESIERSVAVLCHQIPEKESYTKVTRC